MNHIYRLIWNHHIAAWVVVSEIAGSGRKSGSRAKRRRLALSTLLAAVLPVSAAHAEDVATTVVPASGRTNAFISANGVPVVNIEKANERGLSHNRYTRFDVENNGLVLNNGNNAVVGRTSQLAGQVLSNANLVQEASVILNEVVSTNPSVLAGFTEVLGGQADVIIANPNGITCNGCGFINTDRLTFTTGTANVSGDGVLTGFDVNKGNVTFTGQGASVTAQQSFDIVARSVIVRSPIVGSDSNTIAITTGANRWSYTERAVEGPLSGEGVTPAYSVDSTVLGGMYAGRIKIVATDAGVGVRMNGEVAASADDFTLSNTGRIEIHGKVSAERDITMVSASTQNNKDIEISGDWASVSAKQDVSITAKRGQLNLTDGDLYAGRNLDVDVRAMDDSVTLAGTRYAAGSVQVTTADETAIDGSQWGAGYDLSIDAESLAIGAQAATITAGQDLVIDAESNIDLASAEIQSGADLLIQSDVGSIGIGSGSGQGLLSTDGDVDVLARTSITSTGAIASRIGDVNLAADTTISHSGTTHAGSNLGIGGRSGVNTQTIANTGTLNATHDVTVKGNAVVNESAGVINSGQALDVDANHLTNQQSAVMRSGTSMTLNADTVTNSDTSAMRSGEAMTITADTVTNRDSLIRGGQAVTVTADTVVNEGTALMRSSTATTIDAITVTNRNTAEIASADSINVTADALTNTDTARIASVASLNMTVDAVTNNEAAEIASADSINVTADALTNTDTARIASAGSTTIEATTLTNSNTAKLASTDAMTLVVTNVLNRDSALISGAGALTATGTTLTNQNSATVVGGSTLTLNIDTIAQTDSASVSSVGAMVIDADTFTNSDTTTVISKASLSIDSANLTGEDSSTLTSAGDMSVDVDTLTIASSATRIAGATSGTGDVTIDVTNSLSNPGLIESGDSLNVASSVLTNTSTGRFSAQDDLTLEARSGNLRNYGKIYGNQQLTATATGTLTNSGSRHAESARFDSNGNISLTAAYLENQSAIVAGQNVSISAPTFLNQVQGGDDRSWLTEQGINQTFSDTSWHSSPDDYYRSTHTKTWRDYQVYADKPTYKPEITAGGTVQIGGFSAGTNRAANISGASVSIAGQSGSSFTNDVMSLSGENWVEKWGRYIHYAALGPATYSDYNWSDPAEVSSTYVAGSLGSVGVFANSLSASGYSVSTTASALAASPDSLSLASAPAALTAMAVTPVTVVSDSTLGTNVTLNALSLPAPESQVGKYVVHPTSSPGYLVETNPIFTDGTGPQTPEYVKNRFGYDPEDTIQKVETAGGGGGSSTGTVGGTSTAYGGSFGSGGGSGGAGSAGGPGYGLGGFGYGAGGTGYGSSDGTSYGSGSGAGDGSGGGSTGSSGDGSGDGSGSSSGSGYGSGGDNNSSSGSGLGSGGSSGSGSDPFGSGWLDLGSSGDGSGNGTSGAGGSGGNSSSGGSSGGGLADAGSFDGGQDGNGGLNDDGSNGGGSNGDGSNGGGSNGGGSNGGGSNGDGSNGDGSNGGGSNGDGSNGDGSNGDGSNGDGSNGDGSNGDGSNGDGSNGDGSDGDGSDGDGSDGDGSDGDGSDGDSGAAESDNIDAQSASSEGAECASSESESMAATSAEKTALGRSLTDAEITSMALAGDSMVVLDMSEQEVVAPLLYLSKQASSIVSTGSARVANAPERKLDLSGDSGLDEGSAVGDSASSGGGNAAQASACGAGGNSAPAGSLPSETGGKAKGK